MSLTLPQTPVRVSPAVLGARSRARTIPESRAGTVTITVLVGNPKLESRTMRVARLVASALVGTRPAEILVVDLALHIDDLFAWPSVRLDEVLAAVASSDIVIVASPTYKASYTGLLKSFLDRYPHHGLAGVTAIPVMTGGDALHAMCADVHLRPLLVELGASVPTQSLFFLTNRMNQVERIVEEWVQANRPALRLVA